MPVYVEDPISRIVGVHWADDGGGPPDPETREVYQYVGSYEYGYRLGYEESEMRVGAQPHIVNPYIPIGNDPDPFIIHDPANPGYGVDAPPNRNNRFFFHHIWIGPPTINMIDGNTGQLFPTNGISFVSLQPGGFYPQTRYFVDPIHVIIEVRLFAPSGPDKDPRPDIWLAVAHSEAPNEPLDNSYVHSMYPLFPIPRNGTPVVFDYSVHGLPQYNFAKYQFDWAHYTGRQNYDPVADVQRYDAGLGGAILLCTIFDTTATTFQTGEPLPYPLGFKRPYRRNWVTLDNGFMNGKFPGISIGTAFPAGGSAIVTGEGQIMHGQGAGPQYEGEYYRVKITAVPVVGTPGPTPLPPPIFVPGVVFLDSDKAVGYPPPRSPDEVP